MFNEPHLRYTVEKCYIYPVGSEHYNALVELGIDPNEDWQLAYSYVYKEDALSAMRENSKITKYRVRDTETGEILAG